MIFLRKFICIYKDDIFAICRSNSCKINWPEITCIYIKIERHPAHKSKTWLTCNNIFSFHPWCHQKSTKKAKIRQVQTNVLALVFKTQYETIKLYSVLGINNWWISTHIDWTLARHCQTGSNRISSVTWSSSASVILRRKAPGAVLRGCPVLPQAGAKNCGV